ncbi:hypothetical protein J1605_010543 [Eschrichtius robustus]|uniref:Uncharacterized protein n=1 Tax=Eschrichtius robustus TaxID=9764 RepID=A0AB34GTR0_ESCRO|nr:hypothetical protein J1605_010543 [Eschrichtius robustus]
MFFLPPTFESPLPPRAHSSSRHNLRVPVLGGAPRGARSACTRGRRRRPVARAPRTSPTCHPNPLSAAAARGPAGGGTQGARPRQVGGPRIRTHHSPLSLGLRSSRLWSCGEATWVAN